MRNEQWLTSLDKMQAVILSAGRGKRLQPLTHERSKAMLPVLGKPITERVMEQVRGAGIAEFLLVCDPEDEEFQDYFTQRTEIDAIIRIIQQREPLGMAHALSCAAEAIEGDFILSACDNLTSSEFVSSMLAAWKRDPNLNALLAIMPVDPQRTRDVGIVEMDGPLVSRIIEKPQLSQAPSLIASLPLYIFSANVLDYLRDVQISDRGEYEIQDAIQMLIDDYGCVKGIPAKKRLTLTRPQDLISLNRHYLVSENPNQNLAVHIGPHTKINPPIFISEGTEIGSHCVLGPNVYVENDCLIEDHVYVTNSVVLKNAILTKGSRVVDQLVHAKRS